MFSAFVPKRSFLKKKMWTSDAVLGGQSLPCPVYECVSEAIENSWPFRDVSVPSCPAYWHYVMGSFFKVQWFLYFLEKKIQVLTSFPAVGA